MRCWRCAFVESWPPARLLHVTQILSNLPKWQPCKYRSDEKGRRPAKNGHKTSQHLTQGSMCILGTNNPTHTDRLWRYEYIKTTRIPGASSPRSLWESAKAQAQKPTRPRSQPAPLLPGWGTGLQLHSSVSVSPAYYWDLPAVLCSWLLPRAWVGSHGWLHVWKQPQGGTAICLWSLGNLSRPPVTVGLLSSWLDL